MPGQQTEQPSAAPAAAGTAPSEKAESIGRRSKRSLTGRRRDASRASKRSAQQAPTDEKARPESAGQANAASQQKPKKKGGFLSFLNCCGSTDTDQELGQEQPSQPAKPAAANSQAARVPSQRQNEPVSTAGTSADDSKEVVNEKAANAEAPVVAPVVAPLSTPADKPAPSADAPLAQSNVEKPAVEESRQTNIAAGPATAPQPVENVSTERELPPGATAVHGFDATPTLAEQEEEPVLDRTPEQAQRDHEIEMSNSGPSLPLSEKDAQEVVDEENHAYERRASGEANRSSLPPPPPLAAPLDRSEKQTAGPDTAMVNTPEPPQKWLLPPLRSEFTGRKCLVLDLDETLVHSSFKVRRVTS